MPFAQPWKLTSSAPGALALARLAPAGAAGLVADLENSR